MVDVKIEGNRVKLTGYKVKNNWLIPEYEIVTTEETMPMLDEYGKPMFDGNGELIIFSKFSKVSRVLLRSEDKKEVVRYADEITGTKKVSVEKQSRSGKRVRKENTEKQEIAEES